MCLECVWGYRLPFSWFVLTCKSGWVVPKGAGSCWHCTSVWLPLLQRRDPEVLRGALPTGGAFCVVGREAQRWGCLRGPSWGQLWASSARRAALPSHQHPLGSTGAALSGLNLALRPGLRPS